MWFFRQHVERNQDGLVIGDYVIENIGAKGNAGADQAADTAATAVDAPPHGISHQEEADAANARKKSALMDAVPDWKRIMALIVIFADRHRLLDGFPSKRFDADLLGRRQHCVERYRNDLKFDQSILDHRSDISAGLVLGISG